jgi:hypothetical protein
MTNSNVTPITERQPAPSTKFTITALLEGFPVSIEVEGKADALRAKIDRLKAIAPLCPVHNTPMAPSTKRPGTYYCKSSVGQAEDGRTLYCTKKA